MQEVGAPRPELAINAAAPMNPASMMKLVTTYAALELLGPAYRWKTEAYADGDALVLKGYGDPKLNLESFWMLLRALRGRGLRDIQGDIVLDRSYFAPQPEARFDDDTYRPYNVAPDALLVNFKALRFNFIPGGGARHGARVRRAGPARARARQHAARSSSEQPAPRGAPSATASRPSSSRGRRAPPSPAPIPPPAASAT